MNNRFSYIRQLPWEIWYIKSSVYHHLLNVMQTWSKFDRWYKKCVHYITWCDRRNKSFSCNIFSGVVEEMTLLLISYLIRFSLLLVARISHLSRTSISFMSSLTCVRRSSSCSHTRMHIAHWSKTLDLQTCLSYAAGKFHLPNLIWGSE